MEISCQWIHIRKESVMNFCWFFSSSLEILLLDQSWSAGPHHYHPLSPNHPPCSFTSTSHLSPPAPIPHPSSMVSVATFLPPLISINTFQYLHAPRTEQAESGFTLTPFQVENENIRERSVLKPSSTNTQTHTQTHTHRHALLWISIIRCLSIFPSFSQTSNISVSPCPRQHPVRPGFSNSRSRIQTHPTPLGSEDREQPAVAMTVRRSTGRFFYIKKQNRLQIKTNNANLSFFCLIVKLFLAKYESFFFCRSGIFLRENISCSALSEANR